MCETRTTAIGRRIRRYTRSEESRSVRALDFEFAWQPDGSLARHSVSA